MSNREDAAFRAAIASVTGRAVTDIRPVVGGGYTPARRLQVTLAGGGNVFVKQATDALTAGWIGQERYVYENLGEVTFAPRYFGSGDTPNADGDPMPFLVLEDLSDSHWPPPWSPARIDAVQVALDAVHATRGGWVQALPAASDELGGDTGWRDIVNDAARFLSLEVCSPAWLRVHLPRLLEAAEAAPFAGDDLLHLDTRSDNLCFRADGRACIIDWNWACRGNGQVDLAGWLPSLGYETGILPESLLPDAPGYAAWFAGFWAAQAGKPPPPLAPRVRDVQKQQLSVALPWACRALGLPTP